MSFFRRLFIVKQKNEKMKKETWETIAEIAIEIAIVIITRTRGKK